MKALLALFLVLGAYSFADGYGRSANLEKLFKANAYDDFLKKGSMTIQVPGSKPVVVHLKPTSTDKPSYPIAYGAGTELLARVKEASKKTKELSREQEIELLRSALFVASMYHRFDPSVSVDSMYSLLLNGTLKSGINKGLLEPTLRLMDRAEMFGAHRAGGALNAILTRFNPEMAESIEKGISGMERMNSAVDRILSRLPEDFSPDGRRDMLGRFDKFFNDENVDGDFGMLRFGRFKDEDVRPGPFTGDKLARPLEGFKEDYPQHNGEVPHEVRCVGDVVKAVGDGFLEGYQNGGELRDLVDTLPHLAGGFEVARKVAEVAATAGPIAVEVVNKVGDAANGSNCNPPPENHSAPVYGPPSPPKTEAPKVEAPKAEPPKPSEGTGGSEEDPDKKKGGGKNGAGMVTPDAPAGTNDSGKWIDKKPSGGGRRSPVNLIKIDKKVTDPGRE